MRFTVYLLCQWVALAALAENSIYHQGWIDFNKDNKRNVYEDSSQSIAKRVQDLLARMTLDEKIGQLQQLALLNDSDKTLAGELRAGGIGSFLGNGTLIETPVMRNKLQHLVVEQSRLGIPLIFGHDVIHGFRTAFPIPLAEACAWEPGLFEQTQSIAAREAAAAGVDWTFAPMVDLARDPRWGRIAEGFGEDPYLGGLDAAAAVRGFQGTNVADTNRVVACLKHFVGYGAAEGGRDYNTTEISEYTLRNFYLPQFHAGVEAGALTVMSAFNCLSGFPASGNRHTLTDILRGEWKFPGFVVSDWQAVAELVDHGVAADEAAAARLAITAGVDLEMVSTNYHDTLKQLVEQGIVSKKMVDDAVRRILMVKFEKGLFDHPFTDEARWRTAYLEEDALDLARVAAAKSCVLLKNANGILPLSPHLNKLALIGPFTENAQELVGPWHSSAHANDLITFAEAVRNHLNFDFQIAIARGCPMISPGSPKPPLNLSDFTPVNERPLGTNEIADAVAVAQTADVVVLALGEPQDWSGESASRTDLGLPGRQQQLFDAVAATGKPVVVVLFNGRPLAIPQLQNRAAAIVEAWFPGGKGAEAVADLLFGVTDPSGRLTTTFPRNVGQVPFYYNHYNTGRPGFGEYKGNYVDVITTPLYPFGFGLAYTAFEFGHAQLETNMVPMGGEVTVRTAIKNTGARAGTAVAELYLRALAASAGPRPLRELKGFKKILLQPGESREVSFTLAAKDLGYYDARGNWLVEPGNYQLWISGDSATGEPAAFQLLK